MERQPTVSGIPGPASVAPDAIKVQVLATEHWSLLATRSMLWNESFSRAGMFLTVLSASVVALALVAQASDFGRTFQIFALLIFPVVFFLGWATYTRLVITAEEDIWLVIGMNRLRHGYLDIAPELEPYFLTSHHDDEAGVMQTLTLKPWPGHAAPVHVLASATFLIGILTAIVFGVSIGFAIDAMGGSQALAVAGGALAAIGYALVMFAFHFRAYVTMRDRSVPKFPGNAP